MERSLDGCALSDFVGDVVEPCCESVGSVEDRTATRERCELSGELRSRGCRAVTVRSQHDLGAERVVERHRVTDPNFDLA